MTAHNLISIEEALAAILKSVPTLNQPPYESVPVAEALNRITSHNITAPQNIPPFAASAMDGYAVNSEDHIFRDQPPFRLPIQGQSLAGHPYGTELIENCCIRITTGAVLPVRANAIVIQEDAELAAEHIELSVTPRQNAHIRSIGQDVKIGQLVLPAGTQMGALQLGWVSACGLDKIEVKRKLKVAIFSTGDELVTPGDKLSDGEIYDANRLVLQQLTAPLPLDVEDLGILPDDEEALTRVLEGAAKNSDLVLSSGGVSIGDADYVKEVVSGMGELEFWKIAIKPGKPIAFGKIGKAVFFGLPGNPVSAIVTYLLLVKPALEKMCGKATHNAPLKVSAILDRSLNHLKGRTEYQRATYRQSSSGTELYVSVNEDQSSNRFASFRNCNCLIELSAEAGPPSAGDRVSILPLTGLLA